MHRWQAGSSVLPGLVSKKSASRWVDACVVWVLRWVWLKQQQRVISCLLITMTFLSCWHCYTALNSSISFPWTPFLLMLTIFSRKTLLMVIWLRLRHVQVPFITWKSPRRDSLVRPFFLLNSSKDSFFLPWNFDFKPSLSLTNQMRLKSPRQKLNYQGKLHP